MIKKSIILIGYMGVGKSFIGKILSKEFHFKFIDLDTYIESKEKKTINDLFKEKGEIFFRNIEKKYLNNLLSENSKYIISTGGGTPCYSNNLDLINNNNNVKSIYLKASISILTDRLFIDIHNRPLISHLNSKKELNNYISKHLFERSNFYNQADIIIDVENKKIKEIIYQITEELT